ncbi:hypothetical protein G7Y89_g2845 [Cudoniella acicularis]|uniref:Uncharacterized protein n=1 Tax=Cudoniella acicularis TaxID=354080 RepID=A0A8H4RTC2_9HELO|nr:hypothetical protein G7Y89_g2845 [Cudoniella acicularis]
MSELDSNMSDIEEPDSGNEPQFPLLTKINRALVQYDESDSGVSNISVAGDYLCLISTPRISPEVCSHFVEPQIASLQLPSLPNYSTTACHLREVAGSSVVEFNHPLAAFLLYNQIVRTADASLEKVEVIAYNPLTIPNDRFELWIDRTKVDEDCILLLQHIFALNFRYPANFPDIATSCKRFLEEKGYNGKVQFYLGRSHEQMNFKIAGSGEQALKALALTTSFLEEHMVGEILHDEDGEVVWYPRIETEAFKHFLNYIHATYGVHIELVEAIDLYGELLMLGSEDNKAKSKQ